MGVEQQLKLCNTFAFHTLIPLICTILQQNTSQYTMDAPSYKVNLHK
jgi:hypothetical protein